jgi:hypothetical protein
MTPRRAAAPEIPGLLAAPTVVPGRKLAGVVEATLIADGDDFQTQSVPSLKVDIDGIVGDLHRGVARAAGGREPWYPRGMAMRNERQLTLVAADELAEIALALALPEVRPEWIGANLVIAGIPRLSWLPPRTRLFFAGGATLAVEGQNAPCRHAGAAIAARIPDRADIELLFPKVARRLRGLVAWVEKPGEIAAGQDMTARLPEQWIYA